MCRSTIAPGSQWRWKGRGELKVHLHTKELFGAAEALPPQAHFCRRSLSTSDPCGQNPEADMGSSAHCTSGSAEGKRKTTRPARAAPALPGQSM